MELELTNLWDDILTEEEESDGVDISECGLEAYPEFSKASGAKPSVYPEQ